MSDGVNGGAEGFTQSRYCAIARALDLPQREGKCAALTSSSEAFLQHTGVSCRLHRFLHETLLMAYNES